MSCLNKTKYRLMLALLYLGSFGCGSSHESAGGSILDGLSVADLQKEGLNALLPHYEKWDGESEIRVAIFYTPNGVTTDLESDLAYQQIANIQSWITGYGRPAAFLTGTKVNPVDSAKGTEAYEITGRGPRIGGKGDPVDYRITMYVGPGEALAQTFGMALATNHLTMLNGHIYTETQNGFRVAYDSLQTTIKKVYAPAMETFKQNGQANPSMYRIVMFNNCWSEGLEKLVIGSMNDIGAQDFSMISQRGISNYYDFSAQISSLFVNLVNQRSWTTILTGLKVKSPRSSKINPVVREAP